MKQNSVTFSTGNIQDPQLENMLQKGYIVINELAATDGKFYGKKNLPAHKGDDFAQYTGEIRTRCEKLATEASHYIQPESYFKDASIESEYLKEKDKNLENRIKEKEAQNLIDEHELRSFNQTSLHTRIQWAIISTLIINIGETLFNTKAFQKTGENMLFALIISICISFAVFIFSHLVPFLFKEAKNTMQKRLVIIGSFSFITIVFTVLAFLRTSYLESHDVHINPFIFVVFNLFLFTVSTLVSHFVLPTWTEIRQNSKNIKIYNAIKKRKKEIEELKAKIEEIKTIIAEHTQMRIRIAQHANYAADRIRKMYWESIEVFKSNNLKYRTDGLTPDCFKKSQPEPDIKDFNYTVSSLSNKG